MPIVVAVVKVKVFQALNRTCNSKPKSTACLFEKKNPSTTPHYDFPCEDSFFAKFPLYRAFLVKAEVILQFLKAAALYTLLC